MQDQARRIPEDRADLVGPGSEHGRVAGLWDAAVERLKHAAVVGETAFRITGLDHRSGVALADVKIGDMWVYCFNKNNPFEEATCYTNEVLDVKNGYVQYRKVGGTRIQTATIGWFLAGSERTLRRGYK